MAARLPTASMAGFETLFDFEWHLVRQRGASMDDPSSHSLLSSVLHPLQRPGGFPCELPQRSANPAAIAYKLPNQIEWKDTPIGAKVAVMRGEPGKPCPYIVLVKWTPQHMSRPHFHSIDHFITVRSDASRELCHALREPASL